MRLALLIFKLDGHDKQVGWAFFVMISSDERRQPTAQGPLKACARLYEYETPVFVCMRMFHGSYFKPSFPTEKMGHLR